MILPAPDAGDEKFNCRPVLSAWPSAKRAIEQENSRAVEQ
jgi:hypothetical protein